MSTVNYQAAIRKLEVTLLRQQQAVEATNAQIELFRELIQKARERQLDAFEDRTGVKPIAAQKAK